MLGFKCKLITRNTNKRSKSLYNFSYSVISEKIIEKSSSFLSFSFSPNFFYVPICSFFVYDSKESKKGLLQGKRTAFYVVTCYTNCRFPWLWLFPNSGRSSRCSPADISYCSPGCCY